MLFTVIFSLLCLSPALADIIDIDLSHIHPNGTNVYQRFHYINLGTSRINVNNIGDDVGFFIIQVHTQIENVTLSNSSRLYYQSFVSGTNLGLVWSSSATAATFYLYRNIIVERYLRLLLVITVYDQNDPVPGGCNLSFDTPVAPYQLISYTNDYLTVKSQAASAYGVSCDDNHIKIEMYNYYMEEYDNSSMMYFEGIQKMLTVDGIRKHGDKVGKDVGFHKHNRLFSNYRGIGRVFAIIATYGNRSAAYVPAASYGCDVVYWNEDCVQTSLDYWRFVAIIFGILACLFGHRAFKLTMFIGGFTFGAVVTYAVISAENMPPNAKEITTSVIGLVYGIFWVFVWWKFGVPLLSVQLTLLLSGALMTATVFHLYLGDLNVFISDINYWTTFACIILAYMIVALIPMVSGHILSTAIVGSYATVAGLSFLIGGNLEYIVSNAYRRLVVEHFKYAVLDPPLKLADWSAYGAWIIVLLWGCKYQMRHQASRPPFPPNRNVSQERPLSETTPLLRSLSEPAYV